MEDSTSQKLTPAQRGIIACVCLTSFMTLLDAYIVNISLPEIARSFSVASSDVVRINLSYLLVLTSGLSIWGKLADQLGLKRIFLSGYLIFIVSIALCGCAPTLFRLTVGRGFQGLGTSMLLVSSPAFIARHIPKNKQGSAYGIQATAASLGLILGAPLGGLISGLLGWHYIFFVNIPIGLAVACLASRTLPADPPYAAGKQERFDVLGAILLIVGLVLLISGITTGNRHTWHSAMHWLLPLSGLCILFFLFFWEKRVDSPLLPLTVLKNRTFLSITMAFVCVRMVLGGNNFVIPFYLTGQLHLSQTGSGMLMLAFSITYGLISLAMGRRADRFNPSLLCLSGLMIGVFSFVYFVLFLDRTSILYTALFLMSIGCAFGCFTAPATKMVMAAAGDNNAASVAALNRTSIYLASLIGVSLFDVLLGGNGGTLNSNDFKRVYLAAPLLPLLGLFFTWRAYKTSSPKREYQ